MILSPRLRSVLLVIGLLLLASCSGHAPLHAKRAQGIPVRIARAAIERRPDLAFIPGRITQKRTALLTTRFGGAVRRVVVPAGSRVRRGTLLMVVGGVRLAARLRAAQAHWIAARATARIAVADERRYTALYREGAVSRHEMEVVSRHDRIATADLKAARWALLAARKAMGYARIQAPFAGTVARVDVHAGDIVNPGAPLLRLVGGRYEVRANVSRTLFEALRLGERLQVKTGGHGYEALVFRRVGPEHLQTRTHEIKLAFEHPVPLPTYGASATVEVPLGMRPMITIPSQALLRRMGVRGVFAVERSGRVFFQPVRLLEPPGPQEAAIAAGLTAGQRVVLDPPASLYNGAAIRVMAHHG